MLFKNVVATSKFHRRENDLVLLPIVDGKTQAQRARICSKPHSKSTPEPRTRACWQTVASTTALLPFAPTPGRLVPSKRKTGEGSLQASGQSCLPALSSGSALYLLLSPPHRTQTSGAPGLPSELASTQDRARHSGPCGGLGHLQPFLLSTRPVICLPSAFVPPQGAGEQGKAGREEELQSCRHTWPGARPKPRTLSCTRPSPTESAQGRAAELQPAELLRPSESSLCW